MLFFAFFGLLGAGLVGRFIGGNYGLCVVILILLAIFNPAERPKNDATPAQKMEAR